MMQRHSREFARDIYRHLLWTFPYGIRMRLDYLRREGEWPDLATPRTHTERLLHRGLKDRNQILTALCSKDWVKKEVRARLGRSEVRVAETLWLGAPKDVYSVASRLAARNDRWVIKPNNLGGGIIFLPSISDPILREDVSVFLRHERKVRKIYSKSAPVAWRTSEGGVLIEERIGGKERIMDLKVHVFQGSARILSVYTNRDERVRVSHFSEDFSLLFVRNKGATSLPVSSDLALQILAYAERLSFGLSYVRVDFYWDGHSVWFGEVSPYGSFDGLRHHRELNRKMGAWWDDFVMPRSESP